jgi:hypothetical protein
MLLLSCSLAVFGETCIFQPPGIHRTGAGLSSLSCAIGTLDRSLAAIPATAARHPLYDLFGLAALILNDVPKVHPTFIAAVGRLLGEHFGYFGAYT